MVQNWEVVGGVDKGGILVREGKEITSAQSPQRLSTGALVEEIELAGERLHYKRLTGTGPEEGWVGIRINGKELCIPVAEKPGDGIETEQAAPCVPPEPPIPSSAPRCLRPANESAPPLLPTPVFPPLKKYMALKKLVEAASKRSLGDMYGLPFPQTPEEMLDDPEFGAGWLTKAFRAAGSLPEDNSVTRIVSWRRFEGGGSGPKALFEVEYEKPDDSLDPVLFAKMPYPLSENQQQRFIEEGQAKFGDNWGGEISFYRFLSPHTPFPCPKFYFGDLSRESTEAILINACVQWPEASKTEFAPYEVFPPCGKCEDFLLPRPPQEYYFAIMRRLGTFTGLAKCKKLGPELEKINWYDCSQKNDVNCAPGFPGSEISARTFIEVIAPHWFPERARNANFLDKFVENFGKVYPNHQTVVDYLYGDPLYVGLFHQNGNTDNCYFYKREDDTIDAGILDWGSTASMSYGTGFMGCTISALAEMLAMYDDELIRAWADAYHATGAPRLDLDELIFRYRLTTCVSSFAIYSSTNQYVSKAAMEGSRATFSTLPAWNCDAIRSNFGMKFQFGMLYNRLMLFVLKGDVYWAALAKLLARSSGKK